MVTAGEWPDFPREIRPGVRVFRNAADVTQAAARQFVDLAREFTAGQGKFSVALSGGNTPLLLYRQLASPEHRDQIDWGRVHLFWGDERAVGPDHPASNYGMVHRELITRVPVPAGNVHRMVAERADLDRAAQEYEVVMRQHLNLDEQGWPRFHLILLGVGADGHVASLFPGSDQLEQTSRWVCVPKVGRPGRRRMTLTLPVLNAAHNVLFLVVGREKAGAIRDVLRDKASPPLPAQLVVVPTGFRQFLLDEDAASGLELA